MPKQRFGLGRGLDALIPGTTTVPDDLPIDSSLANSALFEIPVRAIAPNPHQPRMPLDDDEALRELVASIQEHGLLQPVLVTLDGEDGAGQRYRMIAGERRWRAARLAGLQFIPAVIREATPQLMLELALVENLQRMDLNPLEEAQGYLMLVEEYGLTQEQVAERVGRDRSTISNTIRLLQLPEEVRAALIRVPKLFTEGHARAVLTITGDAERIAATQHIIAQNLTVRQAEELARRYTEAALRLTPDRRGARVRPQSYETHQLEEEFIRALELKVRLQRGTKGKGSLTLYFTNEDQLQRLYERIVGASPGGTNGAYGADGLLDEPFDITFDDAGDTGSNN